jgi:hypothetical protein
VLRLLLPFVVFDVVVIQNGKGDGREHTQKALLMQYLIHMPS